MLKEDLLKSIVECIVRGTVTASLITASIAQAGPLPGIIIDNAATASIFQGQVVSDRSNKEDVGALIVNERVAVSAEAHTEATPVFSAKATSSYSVGSTPTAANASAFSTQLFFFDVLSSNRTRVNLDIDFLYRWTSTFDGVLPVGTLGPSNGGAFWAVLSTRDGNPWDTLTRRDFYSCSQGITCDDYTTIDESMVELSTNTVYALQITSYSRTFFPTSFQLGTAYSAVHLGLGPDALARKALGSSEADYRLTLSEGVGNAPLNGVPEPSSAALLLAACLAGAAARGLRRRQ